MRNIDTELDRLGVTRIVTTVTVTSTEAPPVPEPQRQPSAVSRVYLAKDEWTWQDLRDYVVHEIEARFGLFPRDHNKETGIFKGFHSRWGVDSQAIARYAFEVLGGRWAGAPISVFRFTKGSDEYFAAEIHQRLSITR